MLISITTLGTEFCYVVSVEFFIGMFSVIMLSDVLMSVVLPSVNTLIVVAPFGFRTFG